VACKSLLEEAGLFDEKMPRFHDWELWLRMAGICRFAYVDRPLVDVYFSENSISVEQESLTEALGYILGKHYDLYARAGRKYLSGIIFSYGHNLCLGGNMRAGRAELIKALKLSSSSMRNWLALGCSLFGNSVYRRLYELMP
jgi:hypothetical protein